MDTTLMIADLTPLIETADPLPAAWLHILSADERARASRFRQSADHRRYLVCRAWLRVELGFVLGCRPDTIGFSVQARGKPVLADLQHPVGLHFNVSHAGSSAALALSDRPVGVDVELRRELDIRAMAAHVFTPVERARVDGAADPLGAFFDIWTAKEAMLKASGQGLGDVATSGSVPVWSETWQAVGTPPVHVMSIAVADGLHAALALVTPDLPAAPDVQRLSAANITALLDAACNDLHIES